MNHLKDAIKIYNTVCDMDKNDYNETINSDILFIIQLIECYGLQDAKTICLNYFN